MTGVRHVELKEDQQGGVTTCCQSLTFIIYSPASEQNSAHSTLLLSITSCRHESIIHISSLCERSCNWCRVFSHVNVSQVIRQNTWKICDFLSFNGILSANSPYQSEDCFIWRIFHLIHETTSFMSVLTTSLCSQ